MDSVAEQDGKLVNRLLKNPSRYNIATPTT
jgi:hypothetical protein